MRYINKNRLLVAVILSVTIHLFSGCKKQLDSYNVNPNQVTASSYYKTTSDANNAILGVYGYITTPFNLGIAGLELRNQRGDELSSIGDYAQYGQHLIGQGSSFYVSDDPYQLMYTALFATNDALAHIPNINFADQNLKNSYIGEAYFLRAFCHFYLLTNYRNIKLYKTTPVSAADFIQPQANPIDVWNLIIADLQLAKILLPAVNSSYRTGINLGRATQGAAAGLLGKVYLYRADIENQPQFYHSSASEMDTLIKGNYGTYSLTPNYSDNFGVANKNNMESVFELQFRADLVNTATAPGIATSGNWFEPRDIAPCGFPVQGTGECVDNHWVLDTFKTSLDANGNLDSRAFGTLIFNDNLVQKKSTDQVTLFGGQTFAQAYPSGNFPGRGVNYSSTNRKWLDFSLTVSQFQGSARNNGVNYRYLRYADVLLMYAEALFKSGAQTGGYSGLTALAAINTVRQRTSVNLPLVTAVNMDVIQKERILELTNEGHRFYDLLRWNQLASRYAYLESTDPYFKKFTNYIPFSSKDAYFPIPLAELSANPLAKQNDGW